MNTTASRSWRWASTIVALGLTAALSACGTIDLGDLIESGASPSPRATSVDESAADPKESAAQSAAKTCVPGMWEMDKRTLSTLLASADILASDSIEGTALLIVNPDGTADVEFIGWTYVIKLPPNPILGTQAPETQSITNDSSSTATYSIDAEGMITMTRDDDPRATTSDQGPSVYSCEGNRLVEFVESMDGHILYNRRG